MVELYPVISVTAETVVEPEALGSKEKFWHRVGDSDVLWLFKYAQVNTGQHWAEKIAAEIAAKIGIPHARVELANFGGGNGSTTESFARDGRELFHGNQILAGTVTGYDPLVKFRQSGHTLANIFNALDRVFARSVDGQLRMKSLMAQYLTFDALIGNTDRHHENWGILRKRVGSGFKGFLAPSYDHASSLGRELLDTGPGKSRKRLLVEGRVGRYAESGHGGVYLNESDKRGLSPLELIRYAIVAFPDHFPPAINRISSLQMEEVDEILDRVPVGVMSDVAREFVHELVSYNLSVLRGLRIGH